MKLCDNYEATLSAWIDGEIEPIELLSTLDHLVDCPTCRDFYRQSRGLEGVLALLRDPREPSMLPPGGWHRIAETSDLHPRWRQLRTKALAAAAAVVFAIGLWTARSSLIQSPMPSQGSPTATASTLGAQLQDSMTDQRFVELTTELLHSDRRYQEKMQEVLDEVSSRSFIAEGSNDASFPEPAENDLELPETEAEDAFVSFGPLWW